MSCSRLMKERYGGKEPILEAIKMIGRSPIEQAKFAYQTFISADYSFFKSVERNIGPEKAPNFHKDLWIKYIPEMLALAKETLKINEINTASTIGKLVKFMYESRCFIFQIKKNTQNLFEATIKTCPLKVYAIKMFNQTSSSNYLRSLASIDKAQLEAFLKEAGIEKSFEASWKKLICLGDDECRLVIKTKA